MSKVNVPKSKVDDFYRYQRDTLGSKQTKKNIVLLNINTISDAISREEEEIVAYLKNVIKRQIKKDKDQGWVIPNFNGTPLEHDLDMILEEFIEEYVICRGCGNPETEYDITSSSVSMRCLACHTTSQPKVSKYLEQRMKDAKKNKKNKKKESSE